MPAATATLNEALSAARQINASQYKADHIEKTIWMVWISGLSDDANILDLPSIESRLEGIKLASFGPGYTWDSEENAAIAKAKELAATIKDDPQSFAMTSWVTYPFYYDQAGWIEVAYGPYDPSDPDAMWIPGRARPVIPDSTPLEHGQMDPAAGIPEEPDDSSAPPMFGPDEPNSSEEPTFDALGPLDEDL